MGKVRWDVSKDEIIRKFYPITTTDKIAQMIGCSTLAVKARASKLKIRKETYWTASDDLCIKNNYSSLGAAWIAKEIGKPQNKIPQRANRLGVKLSNEAYKEIVHGSAREHMLLNNPSKSKGARERLSKAFQKLSNRRRVAEGRALKNREKPTACENFAIYALRLLKKSFEFQKVVSTEEKVYIVDFLLQGWLIIEIDGDHWHGRDLETTSAHRQQHQINHDAQKDADLSNLGFTVARIWESEFSITNLAELLNKHGI